MINQILAANANDELTQATITLNKLLDEILLLPTGPKRWRAVVDVLQRTNPIAGEDSNGVPMSFRVVNQDCTLINKVNRESMGSDKFGRSKDNSKSVYRGHLSMPRIVKTMIEIVDPMAFKGDKNAQKMFNCFPEYRAAEVR
jgi:hypothetical protein